MWPLRCLSSELHTEVKRIRNSEQIEGGNGLRRTSSLNVRSSV